VDEEHVTRYWVMNRGDDRESSMTCDLFSTNSGLEARCRCGETVVRTQRVSSMADAINLCAAWKAAYHAQGWVELSP
jgi:hypothetical protein